ncbi:glycosyltransferase family 4 protein [Pseudorhodoferax sp.]|uniref:glycosyltransferase family 4 protein n=1 Tax=Pseudorhodoferax sp. TaxID=1993553 RepID=UPI0039E21691
MPPAAPAPIAADAPAPARRPLRIAVVTETYPPEVNGVAATLACCVQGLRARGHAVQLVRPRQDASDAAASEVLLRGLPIPCYPHLRMGLPATRTLVRLWTAARPDLVHVVTEGPLGWSALHAARRLRLPLSSDFRTNFHAYGRHYGLAWLHGPLMAYLRRFHNRCGLTMVPTESLRRQLVDEGFARLQVVARGVDTRLFHPGRRSEPLRAAWGAAPDTPVVVHVGRLAPEKNLGLLWQAVQAMRTVDPRVLLVVAGDGPLRPALERAWAGQGVVFAGVLRGEALAAHYASGDVFLAPSTTETFGNVTTEALASGLAVLAYGYAAAARLIVHGDNGLLAPYDQPTRFLAEARRLARAPELVRRLCARAPQAAAGLAWDRIVAEMETAFVQLLQAHAPGRAVRALPPAVAGLP